MLKDVSNVKEQISIVREVKFMINKKYKQLYRYK
jgi:hypothetical protein